MLSSTKSRNAGKNFSLLLILFLICSFTTVAQWTQIGGPLTGLIGGYPRICVVDSNIVWVAGGTGTSPKVYRTVDGGLNWVPLPTTGLPYFLSAVAAKDSLTAFVADLGGPNFNGGNAKLFKTTDAGLNWILIDSSGGTSGFYNDIQFSKSNPDFGIALCDPANGPGGPFIVNKTTDGGSTWVKTNPPGVTNSFSLWFVSYPIDPMFYGFAATDVTVQLMTSYTTSDGGMTWVLGDSTVPLIIGGDIVFNDDKQHGVMFGGEWPNIRVTSNGGNNWITVNTGTDISDFCTASWVSGTNTVFICSSISPSNNKIIRSDDNGLTWQQQVTPNLYILELDNTRYGDQFVGFAITNEGYVLKSIQDVIPVLSQDTIHVPADYSTIQAGIDSAQNGDMVLVDDGTYLENINFSGKAITVASNFIIDGDTNHISNTIIDGSQPSNPDSGSTVFFISGEDTTSILYGFTITGGSGTLSPSQTNRRGGGVLCYQSGARIEYNFIENNEIVYQQSARGGGICGLNVSADPHLSYVIVENNKIRNNRCESNENNVFGAGVYLQGEGRIVGNHIINNEVEFNGVSGSNRNSSGGGILCIWGATADFISVKIYDNLIANNRALSNNTIAPVLGGGVDLIYTDCDFRRNTVKDNRVSGSPFANGGGMRVLFSSPTSFITDNDFINNGPSDASVMVLGGGLLTLQTENLTVERNLFQLNSGLYGGGMYLSEDVEISVLNNRFLQNEANYGGGMYIYADSVISVLNNKFLQNIATDYGGGIAIKESSPLIENNLVAGNTSWWGGGVAVNSTINKSDDNTGINPLMMMSGGIGEFTTENSVTNTLLSPLKKTRAFVSEPLLINNTIVDNTANAFGGGIYNENSQLTVLNTILWGNTAVQDSQLYVLNGTDSVRYSDVQGGWAGEGNIDVYPEFVDTTNGDYHLSDISLCIGAGIDSIEIGGIWFYAPLNDIEGNPRPNPPGSMPDIGAYESPLDSPVYVEKYESLMPVEYALRQNYPNPFNPSTTIEFALPTPDFVTLSIFNILGEKVATLVSENLVAGNYKYHWDATELTSGIYFYRIQAGSFVETKKMILLK